MDSPVPYYLQVTNALRDQILGGALTAHDQMPSETQMIELFGVSRITIRQALKALENEGLVIKVHGKGTFVSKPRAMQTLTRLQSFGEAMLPQGHLIQSKLIAVKSVTPSQDVADKLGLARGESAIEITRVRYLNRIATAYERSYFAAQLGARMAKEDLSRKDMLLVIENDYGIALGHADLVLGASPASDDQARLLGIEAGSPMLHIERLTHSARGEPLIFEHLFHRGDTFRYTGRIERAKGKA